MYQTATGLQFTGVALMTFKKLLKRIWLEQSKIQGMVAFTMRKSISVAIRQYFFQRLY